MGCVMSFMAGESAGHELGGQMETFPSTPECPTQPTPVRQSSDSPMHFWDRENQAIPMRLVLAVVVAHFLGQCLKNPLSVVGPFFP